MTALILSGLVFKENEDNFNIGIKELEKFVKTHFDKDGFTLSRSANDLIFFTKYLLLCRENIKDAQKYLPEFLEDIIKKNLEPPKIMDIISSPNIYWPLSIFFCLVIITIFLRKLFYKK